MTRGLLSRRQWHRFNDLSETTAAGPLFDRVLLGYAVISKPCDTLHRASIFGAVFLFLFLLLLLLVDYRKLIDSITMPRGIVKDSIA